MIAKVKANSKTKMGGTGKHQNHSYAEVCQFDMDYVESVILRRKTHGVMSPAEKDFVDWVQTESGQKFYKKCKAHSSCCIIL